MDISDMRRLCRKALAYGATRVSLMRIEWDVAGRCQSPRSVEYHVRPAAGRRPMLWQEHPSVKAILDAFPGATVERVTAPMPRYQERNIVVAPGTEVPLTLAMTVPCRNDCEACLRARRRLWSGRAMNEYRSSARTWAGTLTLAPMRHHLIAAEARRDLSRQGIDFDGLSPNEQFAERHKYAGRLLTLWMKRVRKESKAPLRYLLVAEVHTGARKEHERETSVEGLPHYHVLVHETDQNRPVTERCLRLQWPHGHSQFRLVHSAAGASYLCKYLAKDARARVRASGAYGKDTLSKHSLPTDDLMEQISRASAAATREGVYHDPHGARPERLQGRKHREPV